MEFFSVQFLVFVLAVWAAMTLAQQAWLRAVVLIASGAYFFNTFVNDLDQWLWCSVFLANGYVLYLIARHVKRAMPFRLLFLAATAAHLSIYLLLSKQAFFEVRLGNPALLSHFVNFVGVSYFLLKQYHICFDIRNDRLDRVGPLEYLAFMLAFHTLLAGPIMRLQDFRRQLNAPPADQSAPAIARNLSRIATGFVKKYVFAAILLESVSSQRDGWGIMGRTTDLNAFWDDPHNFIVAFHVFALYEFLDFSGYCDIVIGIGRMIGVVPPENFRRPYLARNMIDFWTRWHITLAEWVRDYVFRPMTLRLGRLTAGRFIDLLAFFAYTFAFLLVGLWHEISWAFMLWGLSQGVAMGVARLYDALLRKALSRKGYKRYQNNIAIRVVMTMLTVEYFILSVGFVVLGLWGLL